MHVYVHVNLLYFNEFEIFISKFIKIMGKTTRNAIYYDQKREICQLGRSTMTEILKNRDKRCGGNSE
jgi:hypothetical protein